MARSPEIPAARGAGGSHGSPWRAAGVAVVAALALGGSGLIVVAFTSEPQAPPQPPAEAAPGDLASLLAGPPGATGPATPVPGTATAIPAPTRTAAATRGPTPGGTVTPGGAPAGTAGPPAATVTPTAKPSPTGPAPLARSEPVGIRIPKIGVRAKTLSLGLDKEGMVQVPSLDQAQHAGWFNLGPSPGEAGAAVVVGHVDSQKTGPAVFFKLGALRPGDKITVNRKDGKDANFVVDAVKSFPKTAFPTDLVYSRTAFPTLRVVTCGGRFDKKTGNYPDNIIVFATIAGAPRL